MGTLTALGVAKEYKGKGITAHSLWPATVVESYASMGFKLGERKNWRKATVLSDCVLSLLGEPASFTGCMLYDEDYLRAKGMSDEELDQRYSCVPGSKSLVYIKPSGKSDYGMAAADFTRGNVRKVDED